MNSAEKKGSSNHCLINCLTKRHLILSFTCVQINLYIFRKKHTKKKLCNNFHKIARTPIIF